MNDLSKAAQEAIKQFAAQEAFSYVQELMDARIGGLLEYNRDADNYADDALDELRGDLKRGAHAYTTLGKLYEQLKSESSAASIAAETLAEASDPRPREFRVPVSYHPDHAAIRIVAQPLVQAALTTFGVKPAERNAIMRNYVSETTSLMPVSAHGLVEEALRPTPRSFGLEAE